MQRNFYPTGSYSFRVVIGKYKIGFSRISGVSLVNDNEKFTSMTVLKTGGPKETLVPGVDDDDDDYDKTSETTNEKKKRDNKILRLEKALMPKEANPDQEYLLSLIKEKPLIESFKIEILNDSNEITAILIFKTCCIVSYDISELNALSSGYLKQTIGIRYQSASLLMQ